MSKIIKLEINLGRILALLSLIGTIAGASFWVYAANVSHAKSNSNEKAIDILAEEQLLEREMWGPDYRKRISKILDRERNQ